MICAFAGKNNIGSYTLKESSDQFNLSTIQMVNFIK